MKTFYEILRFGCEGNSLRDIIDNLGDDEILKCIEEYAKQFGSDQPIQATLKLRVERDETINAFGAYYVKENKNDEGTILLNLFAIFACAEENNIDAKEILIETLMHEFGHALEIYFDKKVDEDFIEKTVETYREKY